MTNVATDRVHRRVLAALAVALCGLSLGPWWALRGGSVSTAADALRASAWRSSGLWVVALALGVAAALAVAVAGSGRRTLVTAAAVSGLALALVLWRWGSLPCTCGASVFGPQELGWYMYTGQQPATPEFGVAWARWGAAAVLAVQTVLIGVRARR